MKKILQCIAWIIIIFGASLYVHDKIYPQAKFSECGNPARDKLYRSIRYPDDKSDCILAFVNASSRTSLKEYFSDSFCDLWEVYFTHHYSDNALDEDLVRQVAKAMEKEKDIPSRTCRDIVEARAKDLKLLYLRDWKNFY